MSLTEMYTAAQSAAWKAKMIEDGSATINNAPGGKTEGIDSARSKEIVP